MVAGIRRTLAFFGAVALLTAACGDKTPAPPQGGVGGDLGSAPTTSVGTPPSTTDGSGRSSGPSTTRRGGSPSVSTRGPVDEPPQDDAGVRAAAKGRPGAFAGVVLAPGPATRIVLDVLIQSGVSADDDTVASIRQVLGSSSDKPVAVRGPTSFSSSATVYSADDIRRLADARGGPEQGSGTAVIHLLYLDGAFNEPGVLGVAVRGDTVAVFPDQIARAATPFAPPSRIERAVVTHEIGHLLGLVDIYLDEGRDDPEHPGHSPNRNSVMYWAVESDVVAQVLGGPPPVTFDSADQATLRKIRNGAPPA